MSKLISLFLTLIIPINLLYCYESNLPHAEKSKIYIGSHLTYDDIVELLNEIELGAVATNRKPAEIRKIYAFFSFLAKQGALPEELEEVERDFAELLVELPYQFSSYQNDYEGWASSSDLLNQDIQRKMSLWENKWSTACKKHQKEIIIGAIIFIYAVIVAYIHNREITDLIPELSEIKNVSWLRSNPHSFNEIPYPKKAWGTQK